MMNTHKLLLGSLVIVAGLVTKVGSAAATCDVTDYGATGNGVTDDRPAVQSAIDACYASGDRDVYLPSGTYLLSRAGSAYYNLNVPAGTRLRGASQSRTVLKQAAAMGGSVRLLYVSGDDVHVEEMTLDGNKANQTVDEHRAGIFVTATNRLLVQHVTSQNFTGDGFYLYSGARNSTFFDVYATANDRDGIAMGSTVDGVTIVASRFIGNAAQQVDSEPGAGITVDNVSITASTLDGAGVSNDYVLTVSGSGSPYRSHGWTVVGNVIHGATFIVWADDVHFANNTVLDPSTKAGVTVYRKSTNVTITGNDIRMTQSTVASLPGVWVVGTGVGDTPERVVVANNGIKTAHPSSFGVRAEGAVSVSVLGNTIRGAGVAAVNSAGVYVRATIEAEDFRSAIVSGNTISNFGQYGFQSYGNGAAKLLALDVSNNLFDDDSATPTMTTGIRLDDGTGAAKQISLIGNQFLGGVSTPVVSYPAGAVVLIGGTRGSSAAIYSVSSSPEGSLTAPAGAVAIRRDGTPGATFYVKESGTGNTGWAAK